MKNSMVRLAAIAFSLGSALPALADDTSMGVGGMLGNADGHFDAAIVLDGNVTRQDLQGSGDNPLYGNVHVSLEGLGTWGASLHLVGGQAILGLREDEHIGLHFGVEPLNLNTGVNTHDFRRNHFEWTPMVSVGPQVAIAACRALLLARIGGSFGTLSGGTTSPSYGGGLNIDCPAFDLDASLIRIMGADHPVDLAAADISIKLSHKLSLAIRAEEMIDRDPLEARILFKWPQTGERAEARAFITLRRQWY